jgi:hypothetical protein
MRTLRERSEPGREEAVAPKARNRGNPAVLPERGARGASRAKSEASINMMPQHAIVADDLSKTGVERNPDPP